MKFRKHDLNLFKVQPQRQEITERKKDRERKRERDADGQVNIQINRMRAMNITN